MKIIITLAVTLFCTINAQAQSMQKTVELDSAFKIELAMIDAMLDSLMAIKSYPNCKYGGSNSGMNAAMDTAIYEMDKLLNKYYQLIKKELPAEQFVIVLSSQRKWLTNFNQANEYLLDSMPEGSMYLLMYKYKILGLIEERTKELHKLCRDQSEYRNHYRLIENSTLSIIGW